MEGGLDLEKQTSIPVEAELFFLTSLFIELIDPRAAPAPSMKSAREHHLAAITTASCQFMTVVAQEFPRGFFSPHPGRGVAFQSFEESKEPKETLKTDCSIALVPAEL